MLLIRRVRGISMSPALKSGALVVAYGRNFKVSDVVIAKARKLEVIKRVGNITNDNVLLLSDNKTEGQDEEVDKNQILAKVIWPRGV